MLAYVVFMNILYSFFQCYTLVHQSDEYEGSDLYGVNIIQAAFIKESCSVVYLYQYVASMYMIRVRRDKEHNLGYSFRQKSYVQKSYYK